MRGLTPTERSCLEAPRGAAPTQAQLEVLPDLVRRGLVTLEGNRWKRLRVSKLALRLDAAARAMGGTR
jgi:ribosomal protein L28